MDIQALKHQQQAFDGQAELLRREHPGRFVLFRDSPLGYFDTFEQAQAAGFARFGLHGIFLIEQLITRREQPTSLAWECGVM